MKKKALNTLVSTNKQITARIQAQVDNISQILNQIHHLDFHARR